MSMAYRELELTLLSAQELKNVNLITRMDVYAVVSISGDPLTRQCTEPDAYGGRNPCWNATFRFAVPPTAASAASAGSSLHVLLRAERFLGDRDVGEVVVPLSDILAGATGPGPQPPQVAAYQVRKLHRWEPRGVLNVSYRLGPVVAPVVAERAAEKVAVSVYAPVVGVPPQPAHHHPSPVPYQAPPAVHVVAEHEAAAAQNKSHVMGHPVGVPQQGSPRPPAKPEAYRQPPPPPPSPRPAAVHHAAGHEEARRRAPTPPPTPTPPPPTNGRSNGYGQPGPTHVYMGPQTQIIFGGGAPTSTTTTGGPPPTWTTTTTSPARPTSSPAGKKGDGNWALPPHDYPASAAAAESMSTSVISPRSRNEDRWRPSGLSPSQSQQHDTQQQQQAPSHHRPAAASPFSSRSSSSSSPLSPSFSSAHPSPSSSTRSPYSYSAHPSTATSPHSPLGLGPPAAVSGAGAEVTHGTNSSFRSTSASRGAANSSPLPSSSPSPMVPNKHSTSEHE